MKKILLTLAAGLLILSLPVFASAAALGGNTSGPPPAPSAHRPQSIGTASVNNNTQSIRPLGTNNNTFDEYSGYTASIAVHGFQLYPTAKGSNAGMKAFNKVMRAGTFAATGNNVEGYFYTAASDQYDIDVQLNPSTYMEIYYGWNPIAPKGGNVVLSNAYYVLYSYDGATGYGGNMGGSSSPTSTAKEYYSEGSLIVRAAINPATHKMVLTFSKMAADKAYTVDYTSNGSGSWNQPSGNNYTFMITGVDVSPIHLAPTSGYGYSAAWWQ